MISQINDNTINTYMYTLSVSDFYGTVVDPEFNLIVVNQLSFYIHVRYAGM